MRHTRLPEIDLANALSVEPGPALEAELRGFNGGSGNWSYQPTRAATSDIVGAQTPLLGPSDPPPWEKVDAQIRRACTHGSEQIESCLQVAKVLYDKSRSLGWSAVQEPMGSLSIGFGGVVRYWHDLVLADAEGPFIPFFDHRRGGGLDGPEARRMVFSMQHIGVRERNPDLADCRLAVIRFPVAGDARGMRVFFHDGSGLLGDEELFQRVQTVYATWARVSDDRLASKRRARGGGSNPMDF